MQNKDFLFKEPKHLFVLVFLGAALVFTFYGLNVVDYAVLGHDEIFYFFPAKMLLRGEFLWFNGASSYLHPFLYSPWFLIFDDKSALIGMRLESAFLQALGVALWYLYASKLTDEKTGLLSAAIVTFHIQARRQAATLYTEPAFLFFFVITLIFLARLRHRVVLSRFLCAFLSTCILALDRVVGIVAPMSEIWIIARANESRGWKLKRIVASSAALIGAVLMHRGFSAMFANDVATKKLALPSMNSIWDVCNLICNYFSTEFLFLCLFCIPVGVFFNRRMRTPGIYLFFLTAPLFLVDILFPRYCFLLLPFLSLFLADGLVRIFGKRKYWYALSVFLLSAYLLNSPQPLWIPQTPRFSGNMYFLDPTGCEKIEQLNSSCDIKAVSLPFLDQKLNTTCDYQAKFEVHNPYVLLMLSYVDDSGEIFLDEISTATVDWKRPAYLKHKLATGTHEIKVRVLNQWNVGGIGQLLICQDSQKFPRVPRERVLTFHNKKSSSHQQVLRIQSLADPVTRDPVTRGQRDFKFRARP